MSLLSVKFLITCQTKLGQVVYICGNTSELGNWNPQNAMRLYTDSALYPKWDPYRSIFVREGNKLLFKLCIMNQEKSIRWESIPGNREIVANESLLVEFTAHFEEITITPINEEVIRAPRKKTCDILNKELDSDGSSSKQYWKQFMEEEQESVLYITLTTQMRRITQYLWTPLDELNFNLHSQQFDKNFSTRIQKTTEIIHKTSNFYCIMENTENDELVSVLGQDSYLVRFNGFESYSIHNNMVPIFFHIESLKSSAQNQCCFQVFQNIQRIVHAENILLSEKQKKIEYYVSLRLHWDPSVQLVQLLIKKKVSLILVESLSILQLLLSLLTELNIQYHAQDFSKISVCLKNVGVMQIHLLQQSDPKFTFSSNLNKRQRSQLENKYFDFIKGKILKNSNKGYIGFSKTNYVESIKQDDTFAGLIYHRKNVMIINAEKIQDLTSKLMTQIIALSSKPNFEVYIILDKLTLDIKSKFPVSKNNKLVVIGKSGTLYANQQIIVDLFQNLNLQKAKFSEAISKIIYAIQLGLESKQVLASNQTILEFKKGHVGKIGFQILKTKLKQHNEDSLHKLALQLKQNGKYSIKPFFLSEQFIIRSIMQNLSKHVYQDRSMILSINLKSNNQFIHKTNTIFNKLCKTKINIKMRFLQIIPNNEPDYSYISSQEIASVQIFEAKLQFLCEHFLTGSNIKTYSLNMLSPQKGRRSFINKLHAFEHSFENF